MPHRTLLSRLRAMKPAAATGADQPGGRGAAQTKHRPWRLCCGRGQGGPSLLQSRTCMGRFFLYMVDVMLQAVCEHVCHCCCTAVPFI